MPTLILDSKDAYKAKNCYYTHLPLGNMSNIWRNRHIQLDYPNEKPSADTPSGHHTHSDCCCSLKTPALSMQLFGCNYHESHTKGHLQICWDGTLNSRLWLTVLWWPVRVKRMSLSLDEELTGRRECDYKLCKKKNCPMLSAVIHNRIQLQICLKQYRPNAANQHPVESCFLERQWSEAYKTKTCPYGGSLVRNKIQNEKAADKASDIWGCF